MKYKCNYCSYETNDNSNYKKHLNTKKHNLNIKNENKHKCTYCNKEFKKNGLTRHMNVCPEKNKYIISKITVLTDREKAIIFEMSKEINKLKTEIGQLKDEQIAMLQEKLDQLKKEESLRNEFIKRQKSAIELHELKTPIINETKNEILCLMYDKNISIDNNK